MQQSWIIGGRIQSKRSATLTKIIKNISGNYVYYEESGWDYLDTLHNFYEPIIKLKCKMCLHNKKI